jgi:hypothetical protein
VINAPAIPTAQIQFLHYQQHFHAKKFISAEVVLKHRCALEGENVFFRGTGGVVRDFGPSLVEYFVAGNVETKRIVE